MDAGNGRGTADARSPVDTLSEHFVDDVAALDPVTATAEGLRGHDHELTDYSPDGAAGRLELLRRTLGVVQGLPVEGNRDRTASEVLRRWLEAGIELAEADEHLRALRIIGSPVSEVRMVFDLMPTATTDDWRTIATRAAKVPDALMSLRSALDEGRRRGLVAARRQAVACARQADTWGGQAGDDRPFFLALVDRYDAQHDPEPALRTDLERAARAATGAYAELGTYLRDEYAPDATDRDPVGAERYARWARIFNGTNLDLAETYAWGWEELGRIEREIGRVAERILPGTPLAAVIDHLESDPNRAIVGADAFRAWLQDLLDRTIEELDGVHFDIPDPVKRVEAMLAPPGGAAAMYYTGPSEDFSRPGRTWYPTLGHERFPLWGEVSTCYHEGVPGHHLQIAQVRYLASVLTRFQRTLAGCSGHAEGWALYAERLMGELGYLEDPAFELGMLRAHAMRAVRVIIDIGMHLELTIPADERYHPGETWTPELAFPFLVERSLMPADFMASEIDRYLGWPGQAISYKVGERVWLAARDQARRRHGAAFDLKDFHTKALDLGPMGLEQLEQELARI